VIEILLGLLLPFVTILLIVIAVRHGPLRNRRWRVETTDHRAQTDPLGN
jgi:hypothetical protein